MRGQLDGLAGVSTAGAQRRGEGEPAQDLVEPGEDLAVSSQQFGVLVLLDVRLGGACSSVSRSRSAFRLPASRMNGAADAAWVEEARLSRMNGYGSKAALSRY